MYLFCENILNNGEAMFLKTVGFIKKQFSPMKSPIFLLWNRPIYFPQYERFHIKITQNIELVGKFSKFSPKQLIFLVIFFEDMALTGSQFEILEES